MTFKDCIFLPPNDANEINNFIRQLKMKQNCQSYDIPSKFLKLANTVVAKWLAELFNRCINEGVFPDSLKIACITPIPKIRNPQSPSDKLFCSYLSNRKQCTKLGETKSSYMSITWGGSTRFCTWTFAFSYIHK